MNKKTILSVIDKYYLNGLVEPIKWTINDNNLNIEFISPNKDLMGKIETNNFQIEDGEIAIFDTSQLIKLLNVTDSLLIINIKKEFGIPSKLLISDNKYNLEYSLADVSFIPKVPSVSEPEYEVEFDINEELINKFIKAKKAVESEIFIIESDFDPTTTGSTVKIIIGETSEYSNKINFNTPVRNVGFPISSKKFPLNEMKEILEANKTSNGIGYISEQGLLKIMFEDKENNIKSIYYLVAKE